MSNTKENGFLMQCQNALPTQVPQELLQVQAKLGPVAVLLWINMLALSQKRQATTIKQLADLMALEKIEVEEALVKLADYGWINDEGYEIKLCIPVTSNEDIAINNKKESVIKNLLDQKQASFEWLINFWSNKVDNPSREEMQKLLVWVEKRKMSPEVIAVAIEEMCATIEQPHFGYLEGMLRNWSAEGVYSYADLMNKPYLAKVLPQSNGLTIHPEAESKWKELFPDEFDE